MGNNAKISVVENKTGEESQMEKIYFKMKHSGILGIIDGVCAIVIGILVMASGIILLKNKSEILF